MQLQSKPHYPILDALRGVAALMVVLFHVLEASKTNPYDQIINHGYLAVDFFFLLSGFVIGYSYDDRWGKMSLGAFFKRRLIRLHPMVFMGMAVGAVCFYMSASDLFPGIHAVPVWKLILVMFIGFTLIPVPSSMDIRGWQEMHPLNGPGWSLFYEYIANILYAVFVRHFTKTLLLILVLICGAALVHLAVTSPQGDVIGGWSIEPKQLRIGITRMMYPFFAGLLLSRVAKPGNIKNAFGWSSLFVIFILAFPRVGNDSALWVNGLFDSLSIIFLFPLIVWIGASGQVNGKFATKASRFLGDISYPIYITHYPLIYIYTAWVIDNKIPLSKAWPVGLAVFAGAILLAWACLKLYDEPVRKWLKAKWS